MAIVSESDALDGFEKGSFTSSQGRAHPTYRIGSGPAVVVIHEVPGITPLVASFARRVAEHGMTAVLPDLFGTPGRAPDVGYLLESVAQVCVSREFTLFATNKTSPIVSYVRELANELHRTCGGPGVGAVGMCLTGGFALAMSVEQSVIAPVLSQPSLPFPVGRRQRVAVGMSDADFDVVKSRVRDGLCVMGLRFSEDKKSPPDRFERLRAELGTNFVGVEIDSSVGNPWHYSPKSHSVLTEEYVDAVGTPTRTALDDVLAFLTSRLGVAHPA